MKIVRREGAPRYVRDNITSYLLVSEITTDSVFLTTTLVEMGPGGKQRIHSHETEQCYFILEGQGAMTVSNETETVRTGDSVFVPANAPHGLTNTQDRPLRYYSAGSPSFGKEILRELWPMGGEGPSERG